MLPRHAGERLAALHDVHAAVGRPLAVALHLGGPRRDDQALSGDDPPALAEAVGGGDVRGGDAVDPRDRRQRLAALHEVGPRLRRAARDLRRLRSLRVGRRGGRASLLGELFLRRGPALAAGGRGDAEFAAGDELDRAAHAVPLLDVGDPHAEPARDAAELVAAPHGVDAVHGPLRGVARGLRALLRRRVGGRGGRVRPLRHDEDHPGVDPRPAAELVRLGQRARRHAVLPRDPGQRLAAPHDVLDRRDPLVGGDGGQTVGEPFGRADRHLQDEVLVGRRRDLAAQRRVQLAQRLGVGPDDRREHGEAGGRRHDDRLELQRRRRRRVEPEPLGVLGDDRRGDDRRHVVAGRQRELPQVDRIEEVLAVRAGHDLAHEVLAAVVRGQREVPVAELGVEVAQVGGRGAGRLLRIGALVEPPVGDQPVAAAGLGDELVDAARGGRRVGAGLEARLDVGEVDEVLRHALLGEDLPRALDVHAGALDAAGHHAAQAVRPGFEPGVDLVVEDQRVVRRDPLRRLADLGEQRLVELRLGALEDLPRRRGFGRVVVAVDLGADLRLAHRAVALGLDLPRLLGDLRVGLGERGEDRHGAVPRLLRLVHQAQPGLLAGEEDFLDRVVDRLLTIGAGRRDRAGGRRGGRRSRTGGGGAAAQREQRAEEKNRRTPERRRGQGTAESMLSQCPAFAGVRTALGDGPYRNVRCARPAASTIQWRRGASDVDRAAPRPYSWGLRWRKQGDKESGR